MQYSAEIRWFWNNSSDQESIVGWFRGKGKIFDGKDLRTDIYLLGKNLPTQGIKFREDRLEIKVMVDDWGPMNLPGNNNGRANSWCKYSFKLVPGDPETTSIQENLPGIDNADFSRDWLKVDKERLMVTYAITGDDNVVIKETLGDKKPGQGCNVEITKIRIPSRAECFTFGFEAFGKMEDLKRNLDMGIAKLFSEMKISGLNLERSLSYPEYLSGV